MAREPGYCLHKPSGKAYVNLGGKVHYLGVYGTDGSKEKYRAIKAEWLVNRHAGAFAPVASTGHSMAEVVLAFLHHAKSYYTVQSVYLNLERACWPIDEMYGSLNAKDFGVVQFRACRDWWLKNPKRSRGYINEHARRLLAIIKWGVGQGMVPPSVYQACKCVETLKAGRTTAPESQKVTCVPQVLVDATLLCLTPIVADMVRLQQLLGCRPGEVCSITPAMVDRSTEVWTITLDSHKNAWRGKTRTLYAGPKSQAILSKYLLRAENSACFSPIESEKQRLKAKHEARVTPLNQGNRPGSNVARKPRTKPGPAFTTGTYARSILYACKRAFPSPKTLTKEAEKQWNADHSWSPNQLRHSTATFIRKEFCGSGFAGVS